MMQISLILKGVAMGMAEAIPGVSGGTIAFITGIYARLLAAIGNILGPHVLRTWRKEGLAAAFRAADGIFLLQLGGGMVLGLGIAVLTITELLDAYPPVVWAFFFGLIIGSALYVARQITRWSVLEIALLAIGAAIAGVLTVVNPMAGSQQLLFVFLAGMVAISALILPGISGSFILLLLGMYTVVFQAVRSVLAGDLTQLPLLMVFSVGCLFGLALFSRVLSYTFKTFPNPTLALLTGFMLGSLGKLWPWREVIRTRVNSKGETVPFLDQPVGPDTYEQVTGESSFLIMALIALVAGFVIVFVLDRFSPPTEPLVAEA